MFVDRRLGGGPRYYLGRPKDAYMRIPEDYRKSVVFLGRYIQKGSQEEWRLAGTGFFVGVPSQLQGRTYIYLVTAKHVVDGFFDGPFGVRVNTKAGSAIVVRSTGDRAVWWRHPLEPQSVDVAVYPFAFPDGTSLDYSYVALSEFLDDRIVAERYIGAGDETYTIGVFSKMQGKERNVPIVRTGNVATIPEHGELIPNIKIREWQGDIEGYLIESRSLGGISGSPVLVSETTTIAGVKDPNSQLPFCGRGGLYLMGLMHGHWYIKDKDKNEVVMAAVEDEHPDANIVGIAVVVPAKKILEVLNHPELIECRRQADETHAASFGTTSTN